MPLNFEYSYDDKNVLSGFQVTGNKMLYAPFTSKTFFGERSSVLNLDSFEDALNVASAFLPKGVKVKFLNKALQESDFLSPAEFFYLDKPTAETFKPVSTEDFKSFRREMKEGIVVSVEGKSSDTLLLNYISYKNFEILIVELEAGHDLPLVMGLKGYCVFVLKMNGRAKPGYRLLKSYSGNLVVSFSPDGISLKKLVLDFGVADKIIQSFEKIPGATVFIDPEVMVNSEFFQRGLNNDANMVLDQTFIDENARKIARSLVADVYGSSEADSSGQEISDERFFLENIIATDKSLSVFKNGGEECLRQVGEELAKIPSTKRLEAFNDFICLARSMESSYRAISELSENAGEIFKKTFIHNREAHQVYRKSVGIPVELYSDCLICKNDIFPIMLKIILELGEDAFKGMSELDTITLESLLESMRP